MSYARRIITLVGIIAVSTSFSCQALCPHNDAVTAKIEELAAHGKATIENKTYHLIGRDSTNIFYQEKLLENDVQLNGFLKVSRLIDRSLPEKAKAHLIDLVPTPNFCAYKVSLRENEQVIALSTIP
jgi:hypothetical protein